MATSKAVCKPCSRTDESVTATHYCKDCGEHLCSSCKAFHLKFKQTMSHGMIDISQLSDRPSNLSVITAIGMCPQHNNRKAEFYCKGQDALCCKKCVSMYHKHCNVVTLNSHVETVSGHTEKEFVKEKLDELETQVQTVASHYEESLGVLQDSKDAAPKKVTELKEKISSTIDQIGQAVNEQAVEVFETEKSLLMKHLERSRTLLASTKDLKELLTKTEVNGNKTNFFMTCHALKKEAESHERTLQDMHNSSSANVRVEVDVDEDVDEFMQRLSTAVHVRTVTSDRGMPAPFVKLYRDRHAQPWNQFRVVSPEDKKPPRITGSCFLQDGRIVLADEANYSIKIFDVSWVYVTEQKFRGMPGSVTTTGPNEVAVTCRTETKVYMLSVTGLSVVEKAVIDCKVDCYGVVNRNEQEIIVTFNSGPGIVVARKDGSSVYHLKLDSEVVRQLRYPFGVAYEENKDIIYITSASACCVTGLQVTSGQLRFQYTAPAMKWCLGVALDPDGNVYVCGHSCGSIHQISPHGGLIKVLLTGKDGIKQPRHINFFPERETFLLSDDISKDMMQVFKMV